LRNLALLTAITPSELATHGANLCVRRGRQIVLELNSLSASKTSPEVHKPPRRKCSKGLFIKDVRSQGGCPVRAFFGQLGGVLQMRTSALFGIKKFRIFRNLWCVCTDKGDGWASADILRTRGRAVNFSRFRADVFYGRPLSHIGRIT